MSGGGKQMRKFSGFAFALRRCMWKEKKSGLIVKGMWGMGGWKNFDGLYKPIQSAHTYYWYFYMKRINIFFETYGILWESFTGRRAIRICSAWRPLLFTPSSSGQCNRASLLGELCLGTMCFSFYDFTHPWWFVLASPCLCVQVWHVKGSCFQSNLCTVVRLPMACTSYA